MNTLMEKLLNNVCLDERITDGIFDCANNEHISVLRDYLVKRGIAEEVARDFTNCVVEAGKHPERQAYNKNGILVTFPTPQHKQNAIRRGTHFEKDPTKGKGNLWGTSVETGKPRKGPGRPPKEDGEKDKGEFTPPEEGGGQSIAPTGDVSTLPVSGTDTSQTPDAKDTGTTSSVPEPDSEPGTSVEPAQLSVPDVLPPKPPEEREQDRKAIAQMMASKTVGLASPLNPPQPTQSDDEKDRKSIGVAKLYMQEALKVIERIH